MRPMTESPSRTASRLKWWRLIRATFAHMVTDQAGLVAAGCAFYATLALFPAITMLVFIYGLVFDPATVEPQLAVLEELLPPEAFALIASRLHQLVVQPRGTLELGLWISLAVSFYSAAAGMRSMFSALNLAFGAVDRRGLIVFNAVALAMTLVAIMGAAAGIALLVFLPVVIAGVGLDAYSALLVRGASFGLLLAYLMVALALLYRFGPARRASGHWFSVGAVLATVLWLVASAGLSAYIDHVASYDVTYGSIGAVVAIMMWFYVSAYVVLLGAELDAQIQQKLGGLGYEF